MTVDEQGAGACRFRIEPANRLVLVLIVALAAVFAAMALMPPVGRFLAAWFGLHTADVFGRLRLWQFVSSIFLHGGLCHLLGNLLFLYVFGNSLAHAWRPKEFVGYLLLCGVGGNLCFWAFHALRGESVSGMGASGAVFGLMAAFALVFGDRLMLLFFMVPMRARIFVIICVLIEMLLLVSAPGSGISHIAHLGGAATGYLLLKWVYRRQDRLAGRSLRSGRVAGRLQGLEVMKNDR